MLNVMKWKNLHKYFMTFLQGYLLITWTFLDIWMDIFINHWNVSKCFSFLTKVFFLSWLLSFIPYLLICITKNYKVYMVFFQKSAKNGFCFMDGGVRMIWNGQLRFFTPSLNKYPQLWSGSLFNTLGSTSNPPPLPPLSVCFC